MLEAHPRQHADTSPRRVAVIMADTAESISYAQLVHDADRAARLFERLGLVQGNTIAILLENHLRYSELCWAAKNSGITYACLSSQSSVDDAVYIVENSDAKLLVSSAALSATAIEVAGRCGEGIQYLMLDGAHAPFHSYEKLLEQENAIPLVGRRRGPSMLYSSGTTGRPKGVRTALSTDPPEVPPRRLAMLQANYALDADTVLVNPGPLYHAAPGRFMMSILRVGGTVIIFRKFDAELTLAVIEKYHATHGVFVPTMFIRMLQLDVAARSTYDLSSLRYAIHLAAPCPVSVKEQMIDWWGPVVEEMYSGTEAVGHTVIKSSQWLLHKGSVGRATDGCQIKVLDDEGRELPAFEPGVIYMRNGHSFEYHKDAAKTADAYAADGWATMGDIGYLDADDYLYLTDRKAHMIITGGVNVYPREAEEVLYSHPAIADVAVIGVPHPEFGEEVKAVVETRVEVTDLKSLEAEIIAWCLAKLSPVKCPRSVDFVASLPRNDAGKLVKRIVKARYWPGA